MFFPVSLKESQKDLMLKHLDLVIQENMVTNLTRIDTRENGELLHIEDSLIGFGEVAAAPRGRYGDLGTGAGFPGIPLAIATNRETLLVDARLKKIDALDRMVSELGLSGNVSTYFGRIEDLAVKERANFSVLTARALAKLSVLMELASPLLIPSGRLVCYKASIDDAEMQHALRIQKTVGMELVSSRSCVLSDKSTFRTIVVFEKKRKSQIKLPRSVGFAQKKPL